MTRTRLCAAAVLLAAVVAVPLATAAPEVAPPPRPGIDLTGYKTTATATRADKKEFNLNPVAAPAAPGYLGVVVADKADQTVVEAVEPDSPAEAAGLKEGDVVRAVGGAAARNAAGVRDAIRGKSANEKVTLGVSRAGEALELTATLKAVSKPLSPGAATGPVILGLTLGGARPAGGVKIDDVVANGPAATAGLKAGDVILKMDGKDIETEAGYRDVLADKKAGDRVDLIVDRDGERVEARAFAQPEGPGGRGRGPGGGVGRPGGGGGWDDRLPNAWRRPNYKLAIIGIEYPDQKHSARIKDADWEASMFSSGRYTEKSATGERVYGSMNDYYRELSYGTFTVEGKFAGWVEVSKKRQEYSTGSGTSTREKSALLTETLDKYLAKYGKESLKEFDGVFFLFAGSPVNTTRGSLYWPHRANVSHNGKSWPYFIVSELTRGGSMMDISVFCHEFGHMLGLPDLYARPEVPGMEGVGVWCAMSQQIGGGRPQHFCAWSKEQLGWIKPTIIDPRVRQKLILAPVEDDPTQCFKVMIKADGSEYFLLENRKKKGWDAGLPADGLLVWRVIPGNRTQRVFLEESHGIEGPGGPNAARTSVPYPSPSNNAFTPFTTPSSKSVTGGGLPVYVTNIRKLPDGRITFHIGYEYQ
jgi:M6 family metalloprotease-like protein